MPDRCPFCQQPLGAELAITEAPVTYEAVVAELELDPLAVVGGD